MTPFCRSAGYQRRNEVAVDDQRADDLVGAAAADFGHVLHVSMWTTKPFGGHVAAMGSPGTDNIGRN